MTTIVFYGRDGALAKEKAKKLRRGKGRVVIYDVAAWAGTKDGASEVVIMDCVSYFDRERIEYVFGKSDAESIPEVTIRPFTETESAELDAVDEKLAEEKGDIRVPKKRGRKPKAVA